MPSDYTVVLGDRAGQVASYSGLTLVDAFDIATLHERMGLASYIYWEDDTHAVDGPEEDAYRFMRESL